VRTTRLWSLALVALTAAVGAACTTEASPTAELPPGTQATTTTVVQTTTTTAPPVVWPLTGVPSDEPGAIGRPVVTVKMDNSPQARPQAGLNQADVVYELLVEGITRYALVFHSQVGDPVGPVRSARSSDVELVGNLGDPLLAWSGGNAGVVGEVRAAEASGILVDAGVDVAYSHYWREGSRRAPHNLYTNVSSLRELFGGESSANPGPIFAHRAVGAPPTTGVPVAGLTIAFDGGIDADYAWDGSGWARFQVDQLHDRAGSATLDQDGTQVAPPNVVVLFSEYGSSPSDARSPMAISTGSGQALVLSGGHLTEGTWSRPAPGDPWTLADAAGTPVTLAPGRTWVAMPRTGSATAVMDQPTADALLATRG
jgi:hypothetical protein